MHSKCSYAHGSHEIRDRPHLVKTKLCPDVVNGRVCTRPDCNYAHAEEELNTTSTERLENYKTILCFFHTNHQSGDGPACKYGSRCRFAHGEDELRRSPNGLNGSLWERVKRCDTPDTATRRAEDGSSSSSMSFSSNDRISLADAIFAAKFVGCGQFDEPLSTRSVLRNSDCPNNRVRCGHYDEPSSRPFHTPVMRSCNCSNNRDRYYASDFDKRLENRLGIIEPGNGFTPSLFDISSSPHFGTPSRAILDVSEELQLLKMNLAKQILASAFSSSPEVPLFPLWSGGLF